MEKTLSMLLQVVLTGLLDTLYDNLPCAGSNNTHCLQPEHFEMLFSYVERVNQSEAATVSRDLTPTNDRSILG